MLFQFYFRNKPFSFPQNFTLWSYFFWENAGFFKTFIQIIIHLAEAACVSFVALQIAALALFHLTLNISWQSTFISYANIQISKCLTEIASVFLLLCSLTKCCTYAVPVNIAHLLNKPFLFAQTLTPWSYFFLGSASFFKTFMLTIKSLYTSLKLQVFLPKCRMPKRNVPFNIAHLLNRPFSFAMQTFKSLYASLKRQMFFFCYFVAKRIAALIAHSLNRPCLLAMQTFNSLYASLKLQVFVLLICGLAKCCTYAVPVNIAH